jgi:uracil-DNA glycosylase family protein
LASTAPLLSRRALSAMLDTNVKSLRELNAIIMASEPFVKGSRHAVLGEGPLNASIAFVGEQPGDQEDRRGRPFVGPAGNVFDRALVEAHIDREKSYVTNAVKHFKYEQRGKRRIHQKPTAGEVKRYRWWLIKELELVSPKLVVALGATAARALAGKPVAITRSRGVFDFNGQSGFITIHPSYLLRLPDPEAREQAYKLFVGDLAAARAVA